MRARALAAGLPSLIAWLVVAGCGTSTGDTGATPFSLPVGPTRWDTSTPAWVYDGTLHVGDRTLRLGPRVDQFVLGATGVYWIRTDTLMFTSADGDTQTVADVGWANIAASADHSVFATVDQSRGPADRYGAHVMQVAAFDTRTGKQLYRTPDAEPRGGDDLDALYPEIMPLLHGVSDERIFYDDTTIHLDDGSTEPAADDSGGVKIYEGYDETLFLDGYHVGIRGEGTHRELDGSSAFGSGLLSPDRSTLFDVTQWPTEAVVYDAATGHQRRIDAPWDHFSLGGWSDQDTFYGVAERIDYEAEVDVVRARQVVTCRLSTLACTPAGSVIPTEDQPTEQAPTFLFEGRPNAY